VALEVIAMISFGLSTLGGLFKIYHHFDERFDSIDRHGSRVDTDLRLLASKVDSMDEKYAYRISNLEEQMKNRFAPPRQGGTGA
jgi:hypothetical protein